MYINTASLYRNAVRWQHVACRTPIPGDLTVSCFTQVLHISELICNEMALRVILKTFAFSIATGNLQLINKKISYKVDAFNEPVLCTLIFHYFFDLHPPCMYVYDDNIQLVGFLHRAARESR